MPLFSEAEAREEGMARARASAAEGLPRSRGAW